MDNQPAGYNFEVVGKLVKEHECPICLQLIRIATELPCSHLMCRDCLVHYEESKNRQHGKFLCAICKEPYYRIQLKEVKSIDRIIRESIDVKCKQNDEGCDWTGCISNYEDHHSQVCKFLYVECENEGCDEKIQRRNMEKHQESCEYSIVHCAHCEEMLLNHQLQEHLETCDLCPVTCPNASCEEKVARMNMEKHCDDERQYQLVECNFKCLGCGAKVLRHALQSHMQEGFHSVILLEKNLAFFHTFERLAKKCENTIQRIQQKDQENEEKEQDTTKRLEDIVEKQAQTDRYLLEKCDWNLDWNNDRLDELEDVSNRRNKILTELKNTTERHQRFITEVTNQNNQIVEKYSHAEVMILEMQKKIDYLDNFAYKVKIIAGVFAILLTVLFLLLAWSLNS